LRQLPVALFYRFGDCRGALYTGYRAACQIKRAD
jgi:hypothetical protein